MLFAGMVVVLLASCGGGGGDGAAPAPLPTPVATTLPITAANAEAVTEVILEAVTSSTEIVGVVDVVGLPVAASASQGFASTIAADPFAETINCSTGEVTTTWNDADNSLTISTADSFDILFNACFLAESGVTLDGAASLTDMVITGDPFGRVAPWSLAMTYGFDDLSATDSVDTVIIDGALDFAMSSDDNVLIDSSIATSSLTVQHSGDAETLSDYRLSQTIDLNASTHVLSASGTFTSTELEGSVTFETLEDFLVIGDDNPSSGQLLIRDNSSSVLLTVIDNLSVRLDIDIDLDGTIDQTLVVTWDDLDVG
jgi:hypothetical protein